MFNHKKYKNYIETIIVFIQNNDYCDHRLFNYTTNKYAVTMEGLEHIYITNNPRNIYYIYIYLYCLFY